MHFEASAIDVKIMTIKACLSSLGKGPDWVRDTELWKIYKIDWFWGGSSISPLELGKLTG